LKNFQRDPDRVSLFSFAKSPETRGLFTPDGTSIRREKVLVIDRDHDRVWNFLSALLIAFEKK
jgi:hypothetical protein